jgi:hypothetical protein
LEQEVAAVRRADPRAGSTAVERQEETLRHQLP